MANKTNLGKIVTEVISGVDRVDLNSFNHAGDLITHTVEATIKERKFMPELTSLVGPVQMQVDHTSFPGFIMVYWMATITGRKQIT